MAKIRGAIFAVKYNGADISRQITPYITRVCYTDFYESQSDSIEVSVENRDSRWLNDWYPVKGDELELDIYFEGIHLPCGRFQVDEIESSGPPDRVTLRGLAAGFDNQLREEKTRSFENVTLEEIVKEIAGEANMSVHIELDETLQLERVEQNQQSDLRFLKQLAKEYDAAFKAGGNTLYFISHSLLEKRPFSYIMRRFYTTSYQFRDKSHEIYQGVILEYFDGESGEKKEYQEDWACPKSSAGYLRVKKKFENEKDAAKKAAALKRRKNKLEQTGSFTCAGNAKLLAGQVLKVVGWGIYDGNWLILQTSHRINRSSGYTTSMEIKRIS